MNEAIKLAIEKGGYEPFTTLHIEFCNRIDYFGRKLIVEPGAGGVAEKAFSDILLDPAFWVALGKALGWGKPYMHRYEHLNPTGEPKYWATDKMVNSGDWLYHWHRFIDHIADGKEADEFFKALIKQK